MRDEISESMALFQKVMSQASEKRGTINVGYQGGIEQVEASWSGRLKIWWAFDKEGSRYWTPFGIEEPKWKTKYSHNIVCEINVPVKGINRMIAATFAKDDKELVYLLHNGRIGGGKSGVGPRLFWKEYQGKSDNAAFGTVSKRMAVIGALRDDRFPERVAEFVHEVQRIKGLL